jgi:hypothetical protein
MTAAAAAAAAGVRPASADDTRECVEFAIEMGRKIHARLSAADFFVFEQLDAETAVPAMRRGAILEVGKAVGEAMQLIGNLPVLIYGVPLPDVEEECSVDLDAFDDVFDLEGSEPTATEGKPVPHPGDRFDEEIDAALNGLVTATGDDQTADHGVWRMLIDQLSRTRDRLQEAGRGHSKWAMITEGEDSRRRTVKALEYALTLASQAVQKPSSEPILADAETLLDMSLAVRAVLLRLRREVLAMTCDLDSLPDHELSRIAREVRSRLTDVRFESAYARLRANDRYQVRRLSQRIAVWLEGGGSDCDLGRQVLADVHAFVDLLADVNRRAILEEHDRNLRQYCCDALADLDALLKVNLPTNEAWLRYADLLLDLEGLEWREGQVGIHARGELRRGPDADLVQRVARTRELLEAIRV